MNLSLPSALYAKATCSAPSGTLGFISRNDTG
nr:MAG TPA: hypothetical protein [Caudoviricetes sp.]